MDKLIEHLQKRTRPTAIIVSGDHGPGSRLDREAQNHSDLRERFNVFLAVHFPGRAVTLPAGMTLVNLYPLIFREALNAEVVDLPNRPSSPVSPVLIDSRMSGQRRGDCLVPGNFENNRRDVLLQCRSSGTVVKPIQGGRTPCEPIEKLEDSRIE